LLREDRPAVRVACIDIGSNTTRLLVCEAAEGGGLRPVAGAREFTRGLDPVALGDVVRRQLAAAQRAGTQALRVVGTAALRSDRGAYEHLRRTLDVEVELLEAGAEARLAFAGATRHRPVGGRDAVVAVVDVGGGSTELAVGRPGDGPPAAASVPLGSAVLTEAHLRGDPPTAAQLHAARLVAAEALRELRPAGGVTVALAAGGSATTLGRLVGSDLRPARLERALRDLVSAPAGEVAARHDLDPRRVALLPAGLLLLAAAGEVLDVPLRLGAGGLREGVCLDLLARTRQIG
jgi:exopolyphosphatase/guanosine-5'-triphosphate,3'-diphosphate pyrophosphatase